MNILKLGTRNVNMKISLEGEVKTGWATIYTCICAAALNIQNFGIAHYRFHISAKEKRCVVLQMGCRIGEYFIS